MSYECRDLWLTRILLIPTTGPANCTIAHEPRPCRAPLQRFQQVFSIVGQRRAAAPMNTRRGGAYTPVAEAKDNRAAPPPFLTKT
jgi:hypothetical protein